MSSPGCRAGLRCCAPGASPAEQFTLSLWGDRPAPHSNHGYSASHQFISPGSSVAPSGAPPAAQTVMGMQTLMYYDFNSTQTRHLSLPIQTYPNNTPVTRADLNVTDPTSAARSDCSHPTVALGVSGPQRIYPAVDTLSSNSFEFDSSEFDSLCSGLDRLNRLCS